MTPEEHFAAALAGLGFADDPEMVETPRLVTTMLKNFVPDPVLPTTTPLVTGSTDLVLIRDLPYSSLCAHHLLPFFGTATILYQPSGAIAGLGWFPKLLKHLARQPQLQERLSAQLADTILQTIQPKTVGVRLVARQLCVEMRGANSPGEFTVISWRGEEPSPTLQSLLHG